ncbi:erythrocyte membrane protein 1 [Plasmodium falciparum IGH-CR14]|uniref:Erythrocyte membrane protein 1 n=2 Tax=Plasmodium falciparum TaxID=5833 RepID=A0A0L1I467_PLAFA|nr:erythrocyte membrane protein 1 [Plasmodium falciparum IGH-CR14]
MGSSISKEEAKSVVPNESPKSPRNVLEGFAESIKNQAEKDAKECGDSLKGDLKEAVFGDGHFRLMYKQKYNKSYPCYLDYKWHTNLVNESVYDKHPCHGREQNRFDEDQKSECSSVYIRSDGNNNNGIACAPPRRRHMCDKNLEALNESNTQNVHDLLGNVLVTAKYEGDYIINNHPHKGTSEVCIALARSFADIGDIVRGKDMFKPNDKDEVQNGLKNVFKNIHDSLSCDVRKNYPDDGFGNYYKLREAWWNANRDKVWNALTCSIPYYANYVIKKSDDTIVFTDNRKCGHYEGDPPTNLDYVPQFLRWYDEWAEEFCRKRKIKLKNIKDVCRNESEKLYCSHNGYDCTQVSWKKNIESRETYCTGCFSACSLYNIWVGDQKNEFQKQKKKYEKEIETYVSNKSKFVGNINNEYYKDFYTKLKNNYETLEKFLNLLNEGKYCKEALPEEEVINFTKTDEKETLYRSQYCKVCPDCGVICEKGSCKAKEEKYPDCVYKGTYTPDGAETTEINVIHSDDKKGGIIQKLNDFCSENNNKNENSYENWLCYYKSSDDNICKIDTNNGKSTTENKIKTFDAFFDFWVRNYLIDSIYWETELKDCINNTNVTNCHNGCNKNCECFDKWVKTKQREWDSIKKLFEKKKVLWKKYYSNINNNFQGYFFPVMNKLNKEEKWNDLMKNLKEKIDSFNLKNGTNDSEGAIKVLFDHLKDIAERCIDNNSKESCDSNVDTKKNPCTKPPDIKPQKCVKQLAEDMQQKTQKRLGTHGVESNLKGDATKGEYKYAGNPDDFKKVSLCNITKDHSNTNREFSQHPCHGKDVNNKHFDIGTDWKGWREVKTTYKEVYLPPRREHMCTSNLEYLQADDTQLNGSLGGDKVNDSFLGDVLLSAKSEAERTKNYFKNKKDYPVACRAIKYSFADIGDIIRGRDMWDLDDGSKKMEDIFKKIFGTLHQSLEGIKGNQKYKDDEKNNPPYKLLREDWWEANRHQVWRAMKCAIEKGEIPCNGIPIEDYIPQRLRWMTEWAEWYVKFKSKVNKQCERSVLKINSGGNDYRGKPQICKYKDKIEEWKRQWTTLKREYSNLYAKAKVNAFKESSHDRKKKIDIENKDQAVYDFLLDLHLQNGGNVDPSSSTKSTSSTRSTRSITDTNTPYNNAGAYVHDTVDLSDYSEQVNFCDRGKTLKDQQLDEATFEDPSTDDDVATPEGDDDGKTEEDEEEEEEEEEEPAEVGKDGVSTKKGDNECEKVEEILKNNKGESKVGDCNPKNKDKKYPDWTCVNSKFENNEDGPCMPPRRQKLCLFYLADTNEQEKIKKQNNLRDGFIKTAAAETFFAWHYYKNKNGNGKDLDEQLNNGEIPPEFFRSMIYTFGDYRDIFFDTDISAKTDKSHVKSATDFIRNFFSNNGSKSPHGLKRDEWWQKYGGHIWEGMLCGLTHGVTNTEKKKQIRTTYSYEKLNDQKKDPNTLEKFAERPQFLRWFTEWAEDFCHHQAEEIKKLEEECNFNTCEQANVEKKKKCSQQCNRYKEFLRKWKAEYKRQNIKYEGLPDSINMINYKDAPEFFTEHCKNECSCFKEIRSTNIDDLFVKLPDQYKNKCYCPKQIPVHDNENIGKPVDNTVSVKKIIVEPKLLDKCPNENTNNDICNKYNTNRICGKKKNSNLIEHWYGKDMLIPPRRRNICLRNITGNQFYKTNNGKNKFINALLSAAVSEASFLCNNYEDKNEALQAIKYTFADIGDIIKGKDMMDDRAYQNIKVKLEKVLDKTQNDPEKSSEWWEENKKHVWHALLCGYKKAGGTIEPNDCNIPSEENTKQFLRWLIEWGRQVCKEKKEQKSYVYEKCKDKNPKTDTVCKKAVSNYNNWNTIVKHAYDGLNKKYKNFKLSKLDSTLTKENADEYIKEKCSECQCSFKDIDETFKKTLDTNDDVLDVIINKSHIPPHLEDIFNKYNGPYLNCPDSTLCIRYKNIPCFGRIHNDNEYWESTFVKNNKTTNKNVLVPPRRRHICLRVEPNKLRQLKKREENFKKFICSSAFAEAKRLTKVYKDDSKLLQAMKYSFADIGNIVKGDDMMESPTFRYIEEIFSDMKYKGIDRTKWWNKNKYHVWESMLCGYREAEGDTETNENCRFPDIESVPQFLRWFQEWTEHFCTRRNELYENMVNNCKDTECNKTNGFIEKGKCTEACKKYENYVLSKKTEYEIQKDKYYAEFKDKNGSPKDASQYFKDKCSNNKCECFSKHIDDKKKTWKDAYDTFDDSSFKGKCECIEHVRPRPRPPPTPSETDTHPSSPAPEEPPIQPKFDDLHPQADEPFDPTILQTTIPFGVALALSSIAFLFLKKKPKSPVDLIRVLDIHKGDYGTPTPKSSNRYIPYVSDTYKGKTYVYMEGDSDEDKYAFMSDTTDVTSSESEYEELDINDIYVPGSPKYKTLIEVVLEPSKSNGNTPSKGDGNTLGDDMVPTTNTFTDEEWNELKHDFISQYLPNTEPNNNYRSGNSPTNTNNTTTSHDNMGEKPFIMSIHDRNLYTGEEISYNINMSTNTNNDIPKYVSNNVYSGIDLINDTLSGNKHIDIYDEVLKRKENELFGTNHVKQTSIHSVAKNTYSDDAITNKINLFHKWLDRHRDMCEKWENHHERLAKLKEKWENDNDGGNVPSDNHVLNTDVSIEIDMDNPKPINQFSNMDINVDTPTMDNMEDDIYYDVNDNDDDNDQPSVYDIPMDHNKVDVDVPKKVHIEMKILNNTSNGSLEQQFPISDVWNI